MSNNEAGGWRGGFAGPASLGEIRQQIDAVDQQIHQLLNQRVILT